MRPILEMNPCLPPLLQGSEGLKHLRAVKEFGSCGARVYLASWNKWSRVVYLRLLLDPHADRLGFGVILQHFVAHLAAPS
jgi:hypothetical protein